MSMENQVCALAGVFQSARLVDRIAVNGECPQGFFGASLHSLFKFDASDVESIYGGVAGVKLGLSTIVDACGKNPDPQHQATLRYAFGIMHLERKFALDPAMQKQVRNRLEHAAFKAEHFSSDPKSLCHTLAGIYQDTLSQLSFRIKVSGNSQYLSQEIYADQIRALLLAGIRSAFLWRQIGGQRWKLLFNRKKIVYTANELSNRLETY